MTPIQTKLTSNNTSFEAPLQAQPRTSRPSPFMFELLGHTFPDFSVEFCLVEWRHTWHTSKDVDLFKSVNFILPQNVSKG